MEKTGNKFDLSPTLLEKRISYKFTLSSAYLRGSRVPALALYHLFSNEKDTFKKLSGKKGNPHPSVVSLSLHRMSIHVIQRCVYWKSGAIIGLTLVIHPAGVAVCATHTEDSEYV